MGNIMNNTMKTVVIYQSSTGFTKQYAQWIAEELACSAASLKDVSAKDIKGADLVIFGGWVMGGMIKGLEQMRKMSPGKLVVFAVGATPETMIDIAAMKTQNHLEEIPLFYMVGGFRFEKLNFIVGGMLKTLKKSLMKQEEKTAQEQFMAETLGTSFDHSDKQYMAALVNHVKETYNGGL